jgi:hypothetical protein
MRISPLVDDGLSLANDGYRFVESAGRRFATSANQAELDVRPRCQRMVSKTELSLSSSEQTIALF